jgi:hypothetical protein
MIIGHGDVAQAIIDRPDRLYFASGVSNSAETRKSEFDREWRLLNSHAIDASAHLVYFSSLSIYEKNTPYTDHKRAMEYCIKQWFPLHAILRIGNIDWGTNPTTLINHLRARYALGLPLRVDDVYRYVATKADLNHCIDAIPADQPVEFNIYGRRLKVAQIVQEYVIGARVPA